MATARLTYLILLLYTTVSISQSARILLMPWSHYSHVNFFSVAARALQDAGHKVTVLVDEIYSKRVEKEKVPALHWQHPADVDAHEVAGQMTDMFTDKGLDIQSVFSTAGNFKDVLSQVCHYVHGNKEVMDFIKKQRFDLALTDGVPFMRCLYTIPYKYDIPFITLGPWLSPWRAGISTSPSHEPSFLLPIHGPMNFLTRILNTLLSVLLSSIEDDVFVGGKEFIQTYAPEKPAKTFKEIAASAKMWIITADVTCFDFPHVSSPNYRFIGSLSGAVLPKPVPQDFEDFMQSATHGVIIVSFGSGTTLRALLIPVIHKLLNALGRTEQKAIIQFTEEDLRGIKVPDNVIVRSWLPQNDLLGHPKTKLFIGHGGLNGQLEATFNGLPIITLPYISEQKGNGKRAEARKHGMVFDWKSVTEDELYEAITELIQNPLYRENVKKCADIMRSLPDAQDELVFWTNHVLKFGGDHLRPVSADMGIIKFFMLDVFAFIVTIIMLLLTGCYCFCTRCIYKRCCRQYKTKVD